MSLRNCLFLSLALPALVLMAACGGSGSPHATPPPTGGFTNSNFNGTYTFSASGLDVNGAPSFIAGTIVANGGGKITGGMIDWNNAEFTAPVLGQAITGGSYAVSADGRGQAKLDVSNPFSSSIVVDFVLSSNSHGLITEFDGNGSGSGTLNLASSVTQAQLVGSYAFSMSGVDGNGSSTYGTVGSFTLGADGTIAGGLEDFNDQGFPFTSLTLSGNLVPQSSGAPWVATLTAVDSSQDSPFGTMIFDVYPVDSTHLKLIETDNFQDSFGILAGDAYTQQGASVPATATNYVFTMGGGTNNTGPLAAGGLFSIDGDGTISGGSVDINENGSVPSAPFSLGGSYNAAGSGGRTVFNFSGFTVASQFVGYPTASAGLQMLEIDDGAFLGGAALTQSNTTLQASQGYGMNFSGVNLGFGTTEDDIAEFSTTSTTLSGIVDVNDEGASLGSQNLSANYQADSPATGRGEIASNYFNGFFYVADGSTVLYLDNASAGLVGIGTFLLQNDSQAAPASRHVLEPHSFMPLSLGKGKQLSAAKFRHK